MSAPITELTISAWFRHVGTKLSNEDYEAGVEALHATLTRLREAEAKIAEIREWVSAAPKPVSS